MITASELRLGNWLVSAKTDEPFQVDSIPNDAEITAQPIPLTPDILEKCGFEIGGYDMLFWNKGNIQLAGINWADADIPEYQFVNFGWSSNGIVSIHYLHQLQNLYHSLTGNELIIKM